jgi:hypothetical protein
MTPDTVHPAAHMHHVFVDFENVQAVDLSVLGSKGVNFTLLLGAKQTKLNVALVEKLLEHSAAVQLIRLSTSGRNALDFVLAYYVGRAVLADPTGHFHIVSKDHGYDPLIDHLRSRHILAHRHVDCSTLPFVSAPKHITVPKPAAASKPISAPPFVPHATPPVVTHPTPAVVSHAISPEDLQARVLAHLSKYTKDRPKRKRTLVSHLTARFGKYATESDILNLIEHLNAAGHISLSDKGAVTYMIASA